MGFGLGVMGTEIDLYNKKKWKDTFNLLGDFLYSDENMRVHRA